MRNTKRKVMAVLLSAVMLVGSMNVVLARDVERDSDEYTFSNGSTAYYEAYCGATYGWASTDVYATDTTVSVDAYVDMDYYVVYVSNGEIEYTIAGSDSDSSGQINSGIVSAYAEASSNGDEGYKVESSHRADVRYSSHSTNLTARYF